MRFIFFIGFWRKKKYLKFLVVKININIVIVSCSCKIFIDWIEKYSIFFFVLEFFVFYILFNISFIRVLSGVEVIIIIYC